MNARIQHLIELCSEEVMGIQILDQEKFARTIIAECCEVADRSVDYGIPSEDIIAHFHLKKLDI